jgi:single-strand DNA-binding protein
MANGVNKAILVGSIGAEPELKFTNGGQAVLRFRMATNESYKDKDGQRKETTEWHTVTMWGKRGEALNKILSKGRSVYVEGRIQTRTWEDKDGKKHYSTEINATELILMPDGKGRQQRDETPDYEPNAGDDEDSKIPF